MLLHRECFLNLFERRNDNGNLLTFLKRKREHNLPIIIDSGFRAVSMHDE